MSAHTNDTRLDDITRFPEDYLWIDRQDGEGGYVLDGGQLAALYHGRMAPRTETERLLVANREWLRAMLYTIGEYVIHITEGEPLPKWADHWLSYCAANDEDACRAPF